MKQRPTVIQTKEEIFDNISPGQAFYSIRKGNGEIEKQLKKINSNLASITENQSHSQRTINIPKDSIVLINMEE
jgi:hypothetical protein